MIAKRSRFDHVIMLCVFFLSLFVGGCALVGLLILMQLPIGRVVIGAIIGAFVVHSVYTWLQDVRLK